MAPLKPKGSPVGKESPGWDIQFTYSCVSIVESPTRSRPTWIAWIYRFYMGNLIIVEKKEGLANTALIMAEQIHTCSAQVSTAALLLCRAQYDSTVQLVEDGGVQICLTRVPARKPLQHWILVYFHSVWGAKSLLSRGLSIAPSPTWIEKAD